MSRREKITRLRDSAPIVLPSMLQCDFGNLERDVRALEDAGFQALHLDVMDGVFVPNLSYGLPLVETFRRLTDLPLDVHLMISNPQKYLKSYYEAGADSITFHAEAVPDALPLLREIRALGAAGGVVLNPDTPVEKIESALPWCDLVLVMSVQAGFGGQSFMPDVLGKFKQIRRAAGDDVILEVDGGVNDKTIGLCVESGAQWLVVGSGIFRGSDYRHAHELLIDQFCLNGK